MQSSLGQVLETHVLLLWLGGGLDMYQKDSIHANFLSLILLLFVSISPLSVLAMWLRPVRSSLCRSDL